MTRKRDWPAHDVEWFLPGRRRPVAYSTLADSALIRALSDMGVTMAEMVDQLRYAPDARRVAQVFVDAGHGRLTLADIDMLHRRHAGRRRKGVAIRDDH